MTKKADLIQSISKHHDFNLWAEIRTVYESKTKPNYEKIKSILCTEFNLDIFPSQRTIQRRASSEKWQRHESEKDVKISAKKYSDDLWLCVRRIHESNPKLTYKRLKELVQNELQCNDFPSQQAIASKAEHEGWERSDILLKKSDSSLNKLSRGVKKLESKDEFFNFIESIKAEQDQDNEDAQMIGDVYEFDFIREIVEHEKSEIKNLLMTSQVRRKKQAEIIVKSRKRIELNNDFGDRLSDRLVMIYALIMSDKVRRTFTPPMMKELKSQLNTLQQISETYNNLSFNKRENIKFQLSLYGVQLEDLKDVDDAKRIHDLNDETAYEKQQAKLEADKQRIAERRRYIDSGGLEQEVNEEMERRMNEANMNEAEDGVFEEIE
ncbi:hypothetical protein ACKVE0_12850 [Acinetobacter albensis]|uniref:Uncharacterized protein n=1 Tax=Acinetobacter albensis TaxID=1673609 RepID=A0ABW9JVP2_9GAMM